MSGLIRSDQFTEKWQRFILFLLLIMFALQVQKALSGAYEGQVEASIRWLICSQAQYVFQKDLNIELLSSMFRRISSTCMDADVKSIHKRVQFVTNHLTKFVFQLTLTAIAQSWFANLMVMFSDNTVYTWEREIQPFTDESMKYIICPQQMLVSQFGIFALAYMMMQALSGILLINLRQIAFQERLCTFLPMIKIKDEKILSEIEEEYQSLMKCVPFFDNHFKSFNGTFFLCAGLMFTFQITMFLFVDLPSTLILEYTMTFSLMMVFALPYVGGLASVFDDNLLLVRTLCYLDFAEEESKRQVKLSQKATLSKISLSFFTRKVPINQKFVIQLAGQMTIVFSIFKSSYDVSDTNICTNNNNFE